jgi:hypothetical protein
MWDTPGDGHFEQLRPLSYTGAHAFLICFDVGNADSLRNVADKVRYYPFVRALPALTHFSGCLSSSTARAALNSDPYCWSD